jgi:hypothetical protein
MNSAFCLKFLHVGGSLALCDAVVAMVVCWVGWSCLGKVAHQDNAMAHQESEFLVSEAMRNVGHCHGDPRRKKWRGRAWAPLMVLGAGGWRESISEHTQSLLTLISGISSIALIMFVMLG